MTTHELRRLKERLALFETAGCNGAMVDLLRMFDGGKYNGDEYDEYYMGWVKKLKKRYNRTIKIHEREGSKQGKLDI